MVEDEKDIRDLMVFHLAREDMIVEVAENGKKAYDKLLQDKYDLVIMDWMVPEISGLDLISWMKKKEHIQYKTPVLMVTAKSDPESIVQGLEQGADDYMVKPFDFNVLRARAKNLLNRTHFLQSSQKKEDKGVFLLEMGELILNKDSHEVKLKGESLDLTYSEFKMLEILIQNQGSVLSRKQITSFIQGEDILVTGRTIDTHISSLRKKLGSYGEKIETIRGVGYRVSI
ncbi:MAG: response regulator transcription factor [Bdellovibrionales bacterium]|nr:response regulator transcription factor [Bdellovibrionales bacterium]